MWRTFRPCWAATGAILPMPTALRLRHLLFARQPWLDRYFTLQADGSLQAVQSARWQVRRRQAVRKILNFDGEPE